MNKQNIQYKPKVIFIMGPTASGKTKIAIKCYQQLPIKIISVDSTLIYRGMNIGTAKPTLDEQKIAPHKLIDILDPAESYSVAEFCHDALLEIKKIIISGYIPLLVGGSMFYFKALLYGLSSLPPANVLIRSKIKIQAKQFGWNLIHKYLQVIDPISAYRIHPNDSQRLSRALEVFLISGKNLTELTKIVKKDFPYNVLQFIILPEDRKVFHDHIKIRFLDMLKSGFEDEVIKLYLRKDLHEELQSIRSIGYRQMWSYLSGKINYNEMIYNSIYATYQLAKRQITWLKKWKNINKLNSNNINETINIISHAINI